MTRAVLSFLVSGLVLGVGILAATVQSDNFARAARLDELQLDSAWYARRTSQLRAEIERLEFETDEPTPGATPDAVAVPTRGEPRE